MSTSADLLARLNSLGSQVFVSDFDGTMTAVDFYEVVLSHLSADQMPDFWGEMEAGRLTHVEALNGIFQHAPHDEAILRSWLPETRLDPATPAAIRALKLAGWDLVVVSAGSEWYIDQILADVRSEILVIANPGTVTPTEGLTMTWPSSELPWYCPNFGVNKARIVELLQRGGRRVAFAGDGRPDLTAARVIPAELRFARTWLAQRMSEERLAYQPFDVWSDVARGLGCVW